MSFKKLLKKYRFFLVCLFASLNFVGLLAALSLVRQPKPDIPAQANQDSDLIIDKKGPTTFFNYEINRCDPNNLSDTPPRLFIDNTGKIQMIDAWYSTRRWLGDNLENLSHDCHEVFSSDLDPNPRQYNDREWLASTYTLDGQTIYGLVHTEYLGFNHNNCDKNSGDWRYNCWWNSVNSATSINSGLSYTHLPAPNHRLANSAIDYSQNNKIGTIGYYEPSNIIKKDGYYYAVVFNNEGSNSMRNCLMRTSDLSQPNSWRFWDGQSFSINPDRSRCVALPHLKHGHISYNSYLKQYISVYCIQHLGCQYSLSNDLITWSPEKQLLDPGQYNAYAFGGLVQPGDPTRNFEQTGRSPWLFFSVNNPDLPGQPFSGLDRSIVKVRLRFSRPEDVGKYELIDLQMNEKRGNLTLDSSYNNLNASLSGTSWQQDLNSNFLNFNGNSLATIKNQNILNINDSFTIETRLKVRQTPASGQFSTILVRDQWGIRNFGLFLTSTGQLHFSLPKPGNKQYSSSVSRSSVADSQWHTVNIQFNNLSKTVSYFIDGNLDFEYQDSNVNLQNGLSQADLLIGQKFSGAIDHLTIYGYIKQPSRPAPSVTSTPTPTPTLTPSHTPTPTPDPCLQLQPAGLEFETNADSAIFKLTDNNLASSCFPHSVQFVVRDSRNQVVRTSGVIKQVISSTGQDLSWKISGLASGTYQIQARVSNSKVWSQFTQTRFTINSENSTGASLNVYQNQDSVTICHPLSPPSVSLSGTGGQISVGINDQANYQDSCLPHVYQILVHNSSGQVVLNSGVFSAPVATFSWESSLDPGRYQIKTRVSNQRSWSDYSSSWYNLN